MQLFQASGGTVHTSWKVSTDPDAPWSAWFDLGGKIGDWPLLGSPSVGYTPDGRMQLFAAAGIFGLGYRIHTASKVTTDPDSAWSDWAAITDNIRRGGGAIAIGYLPDQRMQLFAPGSDNHIETMWMAGVDPSLGWSNLSEIILGPQPDELINTSTVGYLPDGRMQIFGQTDYNIYSSWKLTTNPDAPWSDWNIVAASSDLATEFGPPTVGYLPDRRMQLFFATDKTVLSTWKSSIDPDSEWSAVFAMGIQSDFPPMVAYLPDGRMQIFAIERDSWGSVLTAWKTSNDPGAAWSNWQSLGGPPRLSGVNSHDNGGLSVGFLPDGRMQLFQPMSFIFDDGSEETVIYSIWKSSTNLNSGWSNWVNLAPPPGGLSALNIGYLPPEAQN